MRGVGPSEGESGPSDGELFPGQARKGPWCASPVRLGREVGDLQEKAPPAGLGGEVRAELGGTGRKMGMTASCLNEEEKANCDFLG